MGESAKDATAHEPSPWDDFVEPKDFGKAIQPAESEIICARRAALGVKDSERTVGVALSGGGIRSATFSLGALQRLANDNLLRFVDYLSTVSGGGYVGATLTWLGTRGALNAAYGAAKCDFPFGTDQPGWKGPRSQDQDPILRRLRARIRYLTPGDGIDLAAGVGVVLRGILSNLIIWIPLLTLAFIVLLVIVAISGSSLHTLLAMWDLWPSPSAWIWQQARWLEPANWGIAESSYLRRLVLWLNLLLVGAGILFLFVVLAHGVRSTIDAFSRRSILHYQARRRQERMLGRILKTIVFLAMLWILAMVVVFQERAAAESPSWGIGIASTIAGNIAGITTFFLARLRSVVRAPVWLMIVASIGAGLILFGFGVICLDYALALLREPPGGGTASAIRGLPCQAWEDLARIFCFWSSSHEFSFNVIYTPWLIVAVIGASFVQLNYLSLHRFYRDRLMETFLPIEPLIRRHERSPERSKPTQDTARQLEQRLNPDTWPLHQAVDFRRDEVIRPVWWQFVPGFVSKYAAMPVTRRELQPAESQSGDGAKQAGEAGKVPRVPFHIINANMVINHIANASSRPGGANHGRKSDKCDKEHGEDDDKSENSRRELKIRGGDNFAMTPLYCGAGCTGWRRTDVYLRGELSLATAIAISGAAANPSAGAAGKGLTRARMVSLLMEMLNIRLGFWAPNPSMPSSWGGHPTPFWPGLVSALAGLFARGDSTRSDWVQLSDGGHFDNTGIYELLRRRVDTIIAIDGSADPDNRFEDLHNLLHRAHTDFGIRFDFGEPAHGPVSLLVPSKEMNYPVKVSLAERGFIVGRITYPPLTREEEPTTGRLVYVTTTLSETHRCRCWATRILTGCSRMSLRPISFSTKPNSRHTESWAGI